MELNPRQELFCQYYTQIGDTFGNATQSYAMAYGYDLENMPRDDEIWKTTINGKKESKERLIKSSYDRAASVCALQGGRLLRNDKVVARVQKLRAEKMTMELADSELMKVMIQDEDRTPKVAAIREFNALNNRITKRIDHTSGGDKIFRQMTDDELIAITSEEGAGS